MFSLFFLIHNDLDLYPHKLYMANKRVLMKSDGGECSFGLKLFG